MARRKRRVEPDGVRLSGPLAHGAAHKVADRMADCGGGPESGKGGRFPYGPPPVSSFASFRGASAGRGRRTAVVDGADIGRGLGRVKEYYRKKEILLKDRPATSFPLPPRTERLAPDSDPPPLPPRTERSGDPGSRGHRLRPCRAAPSTGSGQALGPGSGPGRHGWRRRIVLPTANYFRAAFRRGILKREPCCADLPAMPPPLCCISGGRRANFPVRRNGEDAAGATDGQMPVRRPADDCRRRRDPPCDRTEARRRGPTSRCASTTGRRSDICCSTPSLPSASSIRTAA